MMALGEKLRDHQSDHHPEGNMNVSTKSLQTTIGDISLKTKQCQPHGGSGGNVKEKSIGFVL